MLLTGDDGGEGGEEGGGGFGDVVGGGLGPEARWAWGAHEVLQCVQHILQDGDEGIK